MTKPESTPPGHPANPESPSPDWLDREIDELLARPLEADHPAAFRERVLAAARAARQDSHALEPTAGKGGVVRLPGGWRLFAATVAAAACLALVLTLSLREPAGGRLEAQGIATITPNGAEPAADTLPEAAAPTREEVFLLAEDLAPPELLYAFKEGDAEALATLADTKW